MSNCCSTDIRITGNPEKLQMLFNKINEALDLDPNRTGGGGWLGWLVIYLARDDMVQRGLDPDANNSPLGDPDDARDWVYDQPIRCRGSICYMELNDELYISQDDAWAPQLVPIVKFCERFYPEAKIYYTATEPGCEIFDTNDPDMIGSWVLDIFEYSELPACANRYEYEVFPAERAKEVFAELLEVSPSEKNIRELSHTLIDKYGGVLSINEYKYCSIEDYV